jgi:hypothetical protein
MVRSDSDANLAAVKDDPILDLFLREYSILQDKIDKIGEFRFTIKGWALTLNTGALVAAFATSLNPRIGAVLVTGLVIGLWSLEWRQSKLTDIFQSRSLRIETKIMRRLRSFGIQRIEFSTLMCSPGIAKELRTPIEGHTPDRSATSPLRRKKGLPQKVLNSAPMRLVKRSGTLRWLDRSDALFYAILWGVSVVFIIFQQGQANGNQYRQAGGHMSRVSEISRAPGEVPDGGGAWRESRK